MNDKAPERGFAFAQMTPELLVSDLAQSLAFWRDLCGFAIAYERQEDGFVYLDRAGSQVMLKALASPTRAWMSGKLEKPFGRGVNFQFRVDDVDQLAATLDAANWPFVLPLEDKRYRVGSAEILVRQFAVADPDGYLVRFSQDIAG